MVRATGEAVSERSWQDRTVGIVGGGQLGRMLALEARRMSIRTCVLDPDPDCPSGQVADEHVVGSYGDRMAAEELARRADVITYEFEHIDTTVIAHIESLRPVHPASRVLELVQHRFRQKQALHELGFPLPAFESVESRSELTEALSSLGSPAVLKTATSGYDGKGQAVIRDESDANRGYQMLHARSEMLVLEEYVAFEKELSVICARDVQGNIVCYPVMENVHRRGILDTTIAPARIDVAIATSAQELAQAIMERLEVVGLLCVEMFLTADGRLLVNELAPRPHNSGHYTLDACPTSQFEQLLRALCSLPLGSTELMSPVVMVNLLGDVWLQADGRPNFAEALAVPGVKLHLYGKRDVRRGRKMGHLSALGPTLDAAEERARAAHRALVRA